MLDTTNPSRHKAGRRVTLVSLAANSALALAQIVIGTIGQSQALVADGFHTLSDLVTDGMVLFAIKHSAKKADLEHPYGHGRIETAVTLLLGLLLSAVGIGIAVNAGVKLTADEEFTAPALLTLWVALATLGAKEGLFHYTMRTAKRYDSNMLRANAWHHRSDAISSLIVVIGIAGSILGFLYLDSIAAVIVSIMIIKIGLDLAWQAVRELIDTGLSIQELGAIRTSILSVNGVRALHLLRTRRIAGRALVDVHIIVDPTISVSEGHQISEQVRRKLIKDREVVSDVMVHIDIEDDVQGTSTDALPLRDVLSKRLDEYFKDISTAAAIDKLTLHYKNGRVRIELRIPLSAIDSPADAMALTERFRAAVAHDPQISGLDITFS